MRTIEEIIGDDSIDNLTSLGTNKHDVRPFERTDCVLKAFNNLPLDPYCAPRSWPIVRWKTSFSAV